ncbi:MAG: NifB/NifX family molybdenum-iron cluster-binding protein [Sphaerochaetaceae bacterium]|nr:NifB/NifX family molybdenum-iron cluster-binding protein [Sphaerochaetaceae bacterium]MDC7248028.1 NifB/NifX family molybdenum-iron cluster-binding protein [Sphaerochaetaceae bacterium]
MIISAVATDDGVSFIDRHFGDARFYDLYEITGDSASFMKRIENHTEDEGDEEGHGDPVKARSIAAILTEEGVNAVVSRVYGPNIRRIRKKFLCIVSREGAIEESLIRLKNMFSELSEEASKTEKKIIYLQNR